jgi:hypothetical protein
MNHSYDRQEPVPAVEAAPAFFRRLPGEGRDYFRLKKVV